MSNTFHLGADRIWKNKYKYYDYFKHNNDERKNINELLDIHPENKYLATIKRLILKKFEK
ncbi:MAG: hypothetical protein ABIA75_07515 [Candidatus Neomarinimicrobiota bacterium]